MADAKQDFEGEQDRPIPIADEDADVVALLDKYSKFAEPPEVTLKGSAAIEALAQELAEKTLLAVKLKDKLTETNKRLAHLQWSALPGLMTDAEIKSWTTMSGVTLGLEPYFKASLPVKMPKSKRDKALDYLRIHAPEIIKTAIILEYESKEKTEADLTVEMLKTLGYTPIVTETVNQATLSKWVRVRFQAGKPVPFDTLNAKAGAFVAITKIDEDAAEEIQMLLRLNTNVDDDGVE